MNLLIGKTKITNMIAYLAVATYFWLYLIMYWFGVKGVLPFEMGLHRNLVNILFLIILAMMLCVMFKTRKTSVYELTFIIFIIYAFFIVLANHYLGEKLSDKNGVSVLKYTLYVLVQYLICYYIGKNFFYDISKFKRNFLMVGIAICLIILISFMSSSGIIIDVTDMEHSQKGIYLFTSEYLAFFGFLLVATCNTRKSILITISLCSLLIFCFISRSALFLFIFSTLILMLNRYRYISIISIFIFLMAIYSNIDYLYEHYPRMFFFLDYSNDVSFKGREFQKEIGYLRLSENLFWGDYAGQVKSLGYVGEYIHNIISYWRQFGLISFILIVFLVYIAPIKLLLSNRANKNKNSYEYKLLLMLVVYSTLQITFSRSFSWPFLFLYIGFISAYVSHQKCISNGLGKSI